jgi:hypothetical protein
MTLAELFTIRDELEAILEVENLGDGINQVHRKTFPTLVAFENNSIFGFSMERNFIIFLI